MFAQKNKQSFCCRRLIILCCLSFLLSACSLFFIESDVVLYRVRSGDTLSSIGQKFRVNYRTIASFNGISDPRSLKIGQIIEVPYHGQNLRGIKNGTTSSVQFSKNRQQKASFNSVRSYLRKLRWPVSRSKSRISSKFGWRWLKFHEGVDFAAKTGTPIYAAHSGKVVVSGYRLRGYGKMVIVQGKNMLTVYAHNNKNYVREGQYVSAGSRIASVGSTGKSTGPHLHFEVRIRNKAGKFAAVDPMKFLQ